MIFRKCLAAFISCLLFSVIISAIDYTPISERQGNVHYNSYASLFIFGFLYLMPLFLVVGTPMAMFIERGLKNYRLKKGILKYLISLLLYGLGGLLTVLVISYITFGGKLGSLDVIWSVLLASMLLLHTSIVIDAASKKLLYKLKHSE